MSEVSDRDQYFTPLDYSVFGGMLMISALIGIYFGFISKRKQNTIEEYLMGSGTMSAVPVAISLVATHVSSVPMMGIPAEVYVYGTQYWAVTISILIVSIALGAFFMPVFYDMQAITIYTYLERRFDRRQRTFASILYTLNSILYMPLMVYAPALALSQATGIGLHFITSGICLLCVFYTMFGGIRAVVWTDTIQFMSMIGAIFIVMLYGTYLAGGFSQVLEIADDSGRLILFNFDLDPTIRQSFWMVTLGLSVIYSAVTPECIQRFQSLPNYREIIKCLCLFCIGHIVIRLSATYLGIVIFAKYSTCDPITAGYVKKADQILPYFVMDIAHNLPGLPGIFIAGLFSAGLSSMSTGLNSLAGCIFSDFFKRFLPHTTAKTDSNIMKAIVFVVGMISIGMVLYVDKLGNIFSLGVSLNSVTDGTLLGVFALGMGFRKANRHGAFWGSIVSFSTVLLLAVGAQYYIKQGQLKYESKPFRVDQCTGSTFNESTVFVKNANFDNSTVPIVFRLGFMYYALLGSLLVIVVGYPVSLLTGGCDNLDERLLSPVVRKFNKKSNYAKDIVMTPLPTSPQ